MKPADHPILLRRIFFLGRPLAPFYSGLMRLRAFLYQRGLFRRHQLAAKVVSIGNLTMGGTGKTPMVCYITAFLQKHGRKPAIISRGYRGSAKGKINLVSDGSSILLSAEAGGDEPRLLAETLPGIPVLTGKQRKLTGRYAIDHLAADTIIMDDGFQHLAVRRDLDLVLFNGHALRASGFPKNSRVLPGGDLREPLSALKRAHGFVITGVEPACRQAAADCRDFLKSNFPGRPVFLGRYGVVELIHPQVNDQQTRLSLSEARKIPAFAFCGIASPDSFKQTIAAEHFNLRGFKSFGDHHQYTDRDLELLQQEARAQNSKILLTTEKDYVKLHSYNQTALPILVLRVALIMESDFDTFLRNTLLSDPAGRSR